MIEILSHTVTLGYEFPPGLEGDLICLFPIMLLKLLIYLEEFIIWSVFVLQFTLNFKKVN